MTQLIFMPKGTRGFLKGHPVPKAIREIISKNKLGKKMSEETKNKMRMSHLGKKHKPMTLQGRRNISLAHIGKKQTDELIAKRFNSRKGYRHSEETKIKISQSNRKKIHIIDESKLWRNRREYKEWRKTVFERDNYICKRCLKLGNKLNPHHILNFSNNKEERFKIDNGITLCIKCHKLFHKMYGQRNNNLQQILNFIEELKCK